MIKITYIPPSYAKLLHWKLATSIHPCTKIFTPVSYGSLSLSLVFSSKETWAKKRKKETKTHAQGKLFSSMMKKEKKKEKTIAMFSK
jgi:hypothetical protein